MKNNHKDASYTAAADHSTAAKIGKSYKHEFPASENPNKSPGRRDDGSITSAEYLARAMKNEAADTTAEGLKLSYDHPVEKWLEKGWVRKILGMLSSTNSAGSTPLERMIRSYRSSDATLWQKMKYWPVHFAMGKLITDKGWDEFRGRSKQFGATVRGLNVVARSVSEFGLTVPQKFSAPLFVVWNFTNVCNLKCKHCYQDSEHNTLDNELTLEEKLDFVDQMGRLNIPMLAISGGEPTLSKDIIPVIKRCREYEMHLSMATNGTTMTRERAAELSEAGLRYVEISLDSVDPARHDAFRGIDGMWKKTVEGMKNVVATDGLRLGVAMCVHQGNIDEVEDMIAFAEDIGADCFAHFNFIPVGRGLEMVSGDITPQQREKLLAVLNRKMQQEGGIGIISTAPQLGRVCLAGAALDDGVITCSHAGSGSGVKARVVAKYLGGCGAGRCYIAAEPDGNITPCVYLPHRVMGNIRDNSLENIFKNSVFWDILNDRDHRLGHCEVCTFKSYCGGCRARADAYYGHLNGADPGCVFNDKHWQELVDKGVAVIPEDSMESGE